MTIKEVAELAGVSIAAVSRYMNGGSLSEEKRVRIQKVIKETGYHPNIMAKTMRTGKTKVIGMIVPRMLSESVSKITSGVTKVLNEHNYVVMLGSMDQDLKKESQYVKIMQNHHAAGLIIMGSVMNPELERTLRECKIPVVFTGQKFKGQHCIYHDDFNAVRELMRRALNTGKKKVAYISAFDEDRAVGKERREGAQAAYEEAGMSAEDMIVEISGFTYEDGYNAMKNILEAHPDVEGAIAATDRIALGAMKAAQEAGKKIPEDFVIAGVGNNWSNVLVTPELTSAQLQFERCGELAAEYILDIIAESETKERKNIPLRQKMLSYEVIERGSL